MPDIPEDAALMKMEPCPPGASSKRSRSTDDVLGIPQVPKPAHLAARGGCWFERGDLKIHLGVEAVTSVRRGRRTLRSSSTTSAHRPGRHRRRVRGERRRAARWLRPGVRVRPVRQPHRVDAAEPHARRPALTDHCGQTGPVGIATVRGRSRTSIVTSGRAHGGARGRGACTTCIESSAPRVESAGETVAVIPDVEPLADDRHVPVATVRRPRRTATSPTSLPETSTTTPRRRVRADQSATTTAGAPPVVGQFDCNPAGRTTGDVGG